MRWRERGHLVLLGVLVSGGGTPAVGQAVEGEVARFLARYMEALSARDADQIRASIVADERFVWVEDGEVRYRTADDLLASLAQFPSESPIRTALSDLVVVAVGGSGAHAWARFRTMVGEGPGAFAFGGAISFVLERQGGTWRLVGGHTSAPRSR